METVHVKNTGRCRELLCPGSTVYVQKVINPERKTAWDLIAVQKGNQIVNMDSQIPNQIVREWIENGHLFQNISLIRPETTYKGSRFDLYLETEDGRKIFLEIKGVTLEEEGTARFPDAPSERAVKHVRELMEAVEEGYEAYIFFVIQMKQVRFLIAEHIRNLQKSLQRLVKRESDCWPMIVMLKRIPFLYGGRCRLFYRRTDW